MRRTLLSLLLGLLATPALAEPLAVVSDIGPVAALVAEVQGGRGSVEALVTPGTDAHHVSLRPSQARALASADLAIWIGPALSPWFGRALDRLGPDTPSLTLLDKAPVHLDRRDEEGHDDHADDHSTEADDAQTDPHAWMDPRNALAWLDLIAETLAAADPDHAETYRANAAAGDAAILAATETIRAGFPEGSFAYVAAHDSFQYAEALTGGSFAGAVADSHATSPGPAHLAELEAHIAETSPSCFVTAEAEETKLVSRLAEDAGLPVVKVDALSAVPETGGYVGWLARFYAQLGTCRQDS